MRQSPGVDMYGSEMVTEPVQAGIGTNADSGNVDSTAARPIETAPVVMGQNPGAVLGRKVSEIGEADLKTMLADHPFAREAQNVLSGGLEEPDSMNRHRILDYCEHLRKAYTAKDIDFIRQVFSDDALIIIGHVVESRKGDGHYMAGEEKVTYSIRTKESYLRKLAEVFEANKRINLKFSDFRIMRHPSIEGIYGVTLRQKYSSDGYADDGYLFLLWDFRTPSVPQIHVRTWQPADGIAGGDDKIDLSDFNLQ
ncbi:MAG: hypothetical protein K2K92_06610 [Duncaniella sp.]|nr:hypothetical protein [Duncaniella sp.]